METDKKLGSVQPYISAQITVNDCFIGSAFDAPNPIGGLLVACKVKQSDKVEYQVKSVYYNENKTLTSVEIIDLLNRGKSYSGNLFQTI